MKRPRGWRKGQTLFNFLEWLKESNNVPADQDNRMADPFHISDERLDQLWAEFLAEQGAENEPL